MQHISWAFELLNFSEETCRKEFEREFIAYWNHRATKNYGLSLVSIVSPGGPSRKTVSFHDFPNQRIIVADNRAALTAWLRNSGLNPSDKQISPAWLVWLKRPWIPKEFPEYGRDVLKLIPPEAVKLILNPGQYSTVIFGSETLTGSSFVGTLIRGPEKKDIVKGFRSQFHVPVANIVNSFAGRPVIRCPVFRVDANWVHGRDHDLSFPHISKKKVALIGCGALGSFVARLLAQAGIGNFIFVDPEKISPPNTSRHILGQRYIGKNKAISMAEMLKEDFPHITSVIAINKSFDKLDRGQLEKIADCDIIVSAGITYEGDSQIDVWRQSLRHPPVHICSWTEEFAIVGHAVALFGKDTLLKAFDDNEQVLFRLTEWPAESRSLIVEAGCANVFQPHGAVDLQSTVGLVASLVLDVLCDKVLNSSRRVWQGDQEEVTKRGGAIRPLFTENRCVKEYLW